ncbi:hypothetical protein D9615_010318 [Tricholomella constricta]|uniref:AAA+ ATPase domain-containing protein n=1 Tax=Tricholomella constricta TaxID=117010 RepID=A0A8H5GQ52_9AGAR|nr:hypothetical protein D9615_010318 [Tricholomella constricta]
MDFAILPQRQGRLLSPLEGPGPNIAPSNDRVMSTLNNAIGTINVVKELVPFDLAKGVLSTVSGILTLVKTTITNQKDFLELAEQCHKISLLIWRATDGVPESHISPVIRSALSELNESVNGIYQAVDERTRKRLTSKVFHVTVNKETIAGWHKDLDRFLALFNTELNISTHQELKELKSLFKKHWVTMQFKTEALVSDVLPVRPPIFMGRDALVQETANFLLEAHHVALIGPGGMGKTSIAQAITHATFLDRIARCLGISSSGANIRNLILHELSSSEDLLLVLDNAETFLDAAVDLSLITNSIDEFGARPNIVLMLTTRTAGLSPNLPWKRVEVPALDEIAACAAFEAIYPLPMKPSILSPLLSALDFHPLSINLLAQAAAQNRWSVEELIAAWDRTKAQAQARARLLENGGGKFNSIAATVELSLDSPSLKKLGVFPSIEEIERFTEALCKHSLAYRKSGFITMLAPIRFYVSSEYNIPSSPFIPLLDRLQAFYDAQLRRELVEATLIREEDVNIEHVIAFRIEHCDVKSTEYAYRLAALFLVSLMQQKPRATALYHYIKKVKCDAQTNSLPWFPIARRRTKANMAAQANCLLVLSSSQMMIGQSAEAQEALSEAHNLAVKCCSTQLTKFTEVVTAQAYISKGNLIMAESMYESALKRKTYLFFQAKSDRYIDSMIYGGLGDVLSMKGKPGASEMAVKTLSSAQCIGNIDGIRLSESQMGLVALLGGNYDVARKHFESSGEGLTHHSALLFSLLFLVDVAHRQGQMTDAKAFHDRLVVIFQKADINDLFVAEGRATLAAYTAQERNVAQAQEQLYWLFDQVTNPIHHTVVKVAYSAAHIELLDNNFPKAVEMFCQTTYWAKTFTANPDQELHAKCALGKLAVLDTDFASAKALFSEVQARCDSMGVLTNSLPYQPLCHTLSDSECIIKVSAYERRAAIIEHVRRDKDDALVGVVCILLLMGSSQSILSSEAVVTFVVVAGAVGLGYKQLAPAAKAKAPSTASPAPKGKKKAKKHTASQASPPPSPAVVSFPAVLPGGFDGDGPTLEADTVPAPEPKRPKSKKKKSKLASSTTPTQADAPAPIPDSSVKSKKGKTTQNTPPLPPPSTSTAASSPEIRALKHSIQSSASIDTDGSWTRVEPRRSRAPGTSAAELTTTTATTTSASEADAPTPGTASPVADRTDDNDNDNDNDNDHGFVARSVPDSRRTLAERLLPKPRKTGVDELRIPRPFPSLYHPALARVMRVQPRPDEQPASGFSWGDYEDVRNDGDGEDNGDDDDGWGVVKSRRSRPDRAPASASASPSASQVLHKGTAPEALTKRQRQNAGKRDAQKAQKAQAEEERLAALAKHKRALERERMAEQQQQQQRAGGKGAKVSGGMMASVDERGKLVWE